MEFNPNEHQHLRYNPLKGDWILVSPHRALRPWSGQVEQPQVEIVPEFDPKNPLCPGVKRSSGIVTPQYKSTYTLVLPKRQVQRFTDLDKKQKEALAAALKAIVAKYDNIFKCTFPYSMGWHGAPTGEKFKESLPYWTFHGCYYPPLLRSATVKKFMVGYEMLAQAQRDITPESAAALIKEQSEVRFSDK
ncbi:putative galactose-1-phosphate uridylyltransferase-like Protein [Tribolium castaneum]|uniref:Putative galactose-1-phosphate uridylyltransferase-like Protein n=1 Tax=Tribolium castaneum TaxID=7070 RepID=A0A139WKF4_TRICA|nr:putative galactose-1-phosphate uridylyltransferase-like Protein [Tribolium castaneum]